ncbi:hypothetical protein [Nocardia sp. NPDC047038]|uniref:hypothetical protein n=1 Tax=Nocardia sp. NPDC047038 TaxID=3154338 RepID=UPI0033C46486
MVVPAGTEAAVAVDDTVDLNSFASGNSDGAGSLPQCGFAGLGVGRVAAAHSKWLQVLMWRLRALT